MQISNSFSKSVLPPLQEGGSTPALDLARQLRKQQRQHRRILLLRTVNFWWYRVLLVALGIVIASRISQNALTSWKLVFGGIIGLALLFIAYKRLEFGFLLAAIVSTPFFPTIYSINLLEICPVVPLLPVLLVMILIQAAFRVRKFVWPSFWVIWPLIGLIIVSVVSQLMAQVTWMYQVPHEVLGNPIIEDEITGNIMFLFPLLTVMVATTCLTNRGKWISYIQNGLMALSVVGAVIVIFEFRRSGGNVLLFRYADPTIGFMPLHTLAQLLGLGCIINYARLLLAAPVTQRNGKVVPRWAMLIFYGVTLLINLLALYYSLQNSWWLEVAAALVVMTILFSRKLLLYYCLAAIPFAPLFLDFFNKLSAVKSVDALRLIIYQDAINIWRMRPLLGVGPGNYWAYHQVYSALPIGVRNCNLSGLCVAHSGFLQTLVELGPLGEICLLVFLVVMAIASIRLYKRSTAVGKQEDRILGLLGLGMVCGAAAGDSVSSYFLLPPRQMVHFVNLPGSLTTWVIFGCVLYKDQLWRLAQKRLKFNTKSSDEGWIALDKISNTDVKEALLLGPKQI